MVLLKKEVAMRAAGVLVASMLVIPLGAVGPLNAQTPGTAFIYQGQLKNAAAPATGSFDMRFRLWLDVSDSGNSIGPVVCHDNVAVSTGLFTVQLDFGPNVMIGAPLWLGIEIRPDATSGNCASPFAPSFVELSPRQPLTPTPYAVYATTAQTAGLQLPFTGTSNSGTLLHLSNTSNSQNISTGFFENFGTGNNSRAVSGYANAATGTTYGVFGLSNSASGIGVNGESFGVAGVRGYATNTTGTRYGVQGLSDSSSGVGVYGESIGSAGVVGVATALAGAKSGVFGRSDSMAGTGVSGESTAATGVNLGGYFQCFSTSGYGVYGIALATSGTTYGVYGETSSPGGYGIYAKAGSAGTGVYGVASGGTLTDSSKAVYGEIISGTPGFSYAGLFAGDVRVTQDLIVNDDFAVGGTKSFKIDHPADPANKYLVHYCIESPEPLNVYRGNIVLDSAGRAWVKLPAYFHEINRNVSYTLTAIGLAAPDLHIAHEELDNRFEIAGGHPGQKVCWRIEAVRDDAWMRAHGAPVEIDKPTGECGTYIHPELFGQPPEKGISHRASHGEGAPPALPERPEVSKSLASDAGNRFGG